MGGLADEVSGPGRITLVQRPWGSLYYDPEQLGTYVRESTFDGFRFQIEGKCVEVRRINATDFRIISGDDSLLVYQNSAGLDLRGQGKTWSLMIFNGRYKWTTPSPPDTVVFERTDSQLSIHGRLGRVVAIQQPGFVRIHGPDGTTTLTRTHGKESVMGPPIHQIPYLGRGFWVPFHGLGIFIDLTKLFPMPEFAPWIEWRPILAP